VRTATIRTKREEFIGWTKLPLTLLTSWTICIGSDLIAYLLTLEDRLAVYTAQKQKLGPI
jgi:hypothetical protein